MSVSDEFQSYSNVITVQAPNRRYKSSFFNAQLGDYAATDTTIGKTREIKQAGTKGEPEKTTTENNTLWNLILNRELNFEEVTYEQYRSEEERSFSFSIATPEGNDITSSCQTNHVFLENEEVARLEISLGSEGDKSSVENYGDWLASRLTCTIDDGELQWTLEMLSASEKEIDIKLSTPGQSFDVTVLPEAFAQTRGTSNNEPTELITTIGNVVPGAGVSLDERQLAAYSLYAENSILWIANDLSAKEQAMFVATGYSLMLYSWLYN